MSFILSKIKTKKIISIICALSILAVSLPLSALFLKTDAVTGDIIDFQGENDSDIVAGNNHFTIGGQDDSDSVYFYPK